MRTWNEEELYLQAAEAIKDGRYHVEVDPGLLKHLDPADYTGYIDTLNSRHGSIRFVPANEEAFKRGQARFAQISENLVTEARQTAAIANVSPAIASTHRLHEALDAFAEHIRATYVKRNGTGRESQTTEWGHRFAGNVKRLKDSCANVPLSEFGFDAIVTITNFWKDRPPKRGTTEPIAVDTVKVQVKALRRFVDWLDATDLFDWREPRKVKRATAVRWQDLVTDEEMARRARGRGVKVWTTEELGLLYRYATQWERLLLLLGLNCAFANAEIQSLRLGEIDLEKGTIERMRRKKGVFGKFKLWPETKMLLAWGIERRRGQLVDADGQDITPSPDSLAMLTDQGRPLYRLTPKGNRSDSIANAWNRLLLRIQKDNPDFRKLPFKHLRKTAGNLVRQVADGEIAGVFQSRAEAVATDDEADVYTNRPFDKVFEALDCVHAQLQPMFAQRPEGPVDQQVKTSGPNISRKRIEDIRVLSARGVNPTSIARLVGVSRETVHRWRGKGR